MHGSLQMVILQVDISHLKAFCQCHLSDRCRKIMLDKTSKFQVTSCQHQSSIFQKSPQQHLINYLKYSVIAKNSKKCYRQLKYIYIYYFFSTYNSNHTIPLDLGNFFIFNLGYFSLNYNCGKSNAS